MAFLDNSGDIILDAVLTDTGRMRLAQGDGSFKISKFALGDDEINYGLYNKNHTSGSAYFDLEVLQTPVLEAFTNNTSNLKTKLLTISRTNVLFMPVLRLNKIRNTDGSAGSPVMAGPSDMFRRSGGTTVGSTSDSRFYVAVDDDTYNAMTHFRGAGSTADSSTGFQFGGIIKGYSGGSVGSSGVKNLIRVDQGLDTNEIAPELGMDSDLYESAYIVELDYRLGRVKHHNSDTSVASVNFIDDDNIASYYISSTGPSGYINPYSNSNPAEAQTNDGSYDINDLDGLNTQVFQGPRGSTLHFRIQASQELQSSTYLFTQLGTSEDADGSGNILGFPASDGGLPGTTTFYLDSTVRVIGANTGFRLDIPIRFVKIK